MAEGTEPPATGSPTADGVAADGVKVAGGASDAHNSKHRRSTGRPRPAQADAAQPESAKASSDQQARDAYREQLRRLSGDTSPTRVAQPPSAVAASTTQPGQTQPRQAAVAQSSEAGVAQPPSGMTVSEPNPGHIEPTPAVSKSVVEQPAPATTFAPHPDANPNSPADTAYRNDLRNFAAGDPHAAPMVVLAHPEARNTTTVHNFIKNVAFDQVHIWESPFKLRDSDATWAVPFGIVTGGLIATDHDLSKQLAKPSRKSISDNIANAGLAGSIGVGAGIYALGAMTGDDHKRETGLLSGEAFVNATLVAEALKYAVGRQRPFEGNGFGHIGKGGSSFPSEHAIGTFAIATVVAHEYPNPFVQIGAYGIASAVAASRVTAGQHFPTDVFVGGAFGYLIGRKIYNDHHNGELDGAEYGTFVKEGHHDAEHSGSAYVPLESWIYPAIDRLSGMGLIHSNFDSERPWTRLECERLTQEAADTARDRDTDSATEALIGSLQQEFRREDEVRAGNSNNRSVDLESIYTRFEEISGPPLRDGYHFGQTLYNDYGRPYAQGFNNVTGFSARATSGPLVLYFRGEYQHAPANPAYTPQLLAEIKPFDNGSAPLANQFPAADRFQVLDAYIGVNFVGNELTLGQQSLWWGPGTGGPFMLTDNAEPVKMIRLSRVSPIMIPGPLHFLGPFKYEAFLGQLDGHHFDVANNVLYGPHLHTQPFLQGQRFTFKPTENFEFGFTRTGIFGGDGIPFTAHEFYLATFSTGNTFPGAVGDPGDRRSGVDVTYRVPKLRDWLTFYADEFSEDEISPLFIPRRSAMHAGIYMAKLPKFHKLDLRVEGIYTDIPSFADAKGFFYTNFAFRDGFTNNGDLLGSWIGREGRGVYATSTLWLSSRNTIQFGYREAVADQEFIQGGRYQDESIRANFTLRKDLDVSAFVQYENWRFPALATGLQTNITSSVQLTYQPRWRKGDR